MAIELVDSHTHLDATDFDLDRQEVIARARQAGVTRIVTIGAGYGAQSAHNALALATEYDFIWASVGIHPHDAQTPHEPDVIRKLADHPRAVAIGETGLDFFKNLSPPDLQELWFRSQIEIALEIKKPLIIHSREAGEACFKILTEMNAKDVGGVFHCYAEDAEFAKRLASINFMISVPGSITFKKADKFREIVKAIPLDQIMVETDAPYLTPETFRGKRCEAMHVVHTAKKLAEVKGMEFEEVAKITTANALRFFSIN